MLTLILAGTSILAIADSAEVTTHDWGWETPDTHWPINAGVTVAEVESLPAGCAPGWSYDGESFGAPLPWATLEEAKAARLAELAAYRWQIETGGIVRNGATIATDDRSKMLITGALELVDDDPQKIIKFKAASGWVTMDAATVIFIAREIGDHVQACFARESDLDAAINACTTVAEVAAVDITTGWPSNG